MTVEVGVVANKDAESLSLDSLKVTYGGMLAGRVEKPEALTTTTIYSMLSIQSVGVHCIAKMETSGL